MQRASAALDAVRDAFLVRNERAVQRTLDAATLNANLTGIKLEYGEQIAALCGLPTDMRTEDVLETWDQSPETAAISRVRPTASLANRSSPRRRTSATRSV